VTKGQVEANQVDDDFDCSSISYSPLLMQIAKERFYFSFSLLFTSDRLMTAISFTQKILISLCKDFNFLDILWSYQSVS
jgi:hypothetical protein